MKVNAFVKSITDPCGDGCAFLDNNKNHTLEGCFPLNFHLITFLLSHAAAVVIRETLIKFSYAHFSNAAQIKLFRAVIMTLHLYYVQPCTLEA